MVDFWLWTKFLETYENSENKKNKIRLYDPTPYCGAYFMKYLLEK